MKRDYVYTAIITILLAMLLSKYQVEPEVSTVHEVVYVPVMPDDIPTAEEVQDRIAETKEEFRAQWDESSRRYNEMRKKLGLEPFFKE